LYGWPDGNGATIGEYVTMPYKLAKKANANLTIGNHTSIQSHVLYSSAKVTVGNSVIIGSDVEITTVSHNVDSVDWEHKYYGIEIEDYCWLATRVFVLPSCQRIGYGACAAGSMVSEECRTDVYCYRQSGCRVMEAKDGTYRLMRRVYA